MKRTIVVLVLFLLFSITSNAQIYKGLGIKLGTSVANQIDKAFSSGSLNYEYGFSGGIFKEIHLYEKLNIVAEINYTQKGAYDEFYKEMNEYGNYTGSDYVHRKLNFASFGLLCKYGGNADKFSPYILAGLRMDIFISGEKKFEFFNKDKSIDSLLTSWYDFPLNNNKTFGATIGLGLDYKPSKSLTVFVEGTFNPDFSYLGKYLKFGYEYSTKNYSFDLRTGIKF
jgi:hypothetical protein